MRYIGFEDNLRILGLAVFLSAVKEGDMDYIRRTAETYNIEPEALISDIESGKKVWKEWRKITW